VEIEILKMGERGRDQEEHSSKSAQTVPETLSRKNPSQKRACRVAQGVGPEFSTGEKMGGGNLLG
jgi:hypothetical protein